MARPVVFVHGFRYDPSWSYLSGPKEDNHPEAHLFPRWREMLQCAREDTVPFMWFSDPGIWGSWWHKRWNRYRYAWDLATAASDSLSRVLASHPRGSDIVCHSLGSRVTMLALLQCPISAHRVLVLNGAEYAATGEATARACRDTKFYNVVVPKDVVVGKLARFAPGPGNDFLGNHGAQTSHNWTNLYLDSDCAAAAWARQHGLGPFSGDNPDSIGDHHFSYENTANWPLYRAILSGEWDKWVRRRSRLEERD